MKNRRGNFATKFPNSKVIRFRTKEAYSNAQEVMSKGRFSNIAQMLERIKQCPTGFEYTETSDRKVKEFEKRFNGIEIED